MIRPPAPARPGDTPTSLADRDIDDEMQGMCATLEATIASCRKLIEELRDSPAPQAAVEQIADELRPQEEILEIARAGAERAREWEDDPVTTIQSYAHSVRMENIRAEAKLAHLRRLQDPDEL